MNEPQGAAGNIKEVNKAEAFPMSKDRAPVSAEEFSEKDIADITREVVSRILGSQK